jgi:hypothetical protein
MMPSPIRRMPTKNPPVQIKGKLSLPKVKSPPPMQTTPKKILIMAVSLPAKLKHSVPSVDPYVAKGPENIVVDRFSSDGLPLHNLCRCNAMEAKHGLNCSPSTLLLKRFRNIRYGISDLMRGK